MVDIGTVVGSEVKKNKDGDDDVRILQVEFSNKDDVQSVELFPGSGEEVSPMPGDKVIVVDLSPSYRIAVSSNCYKVPEVDFGEKMIYSYDENGIPLSHIIMHDDGNVEIQGDGDYAVRFNELKSAFDELKSNLNDAIQRINLIATTLKTWVIPPAPDGGAALQAQANVVLAVDVSQSTSSVDKSMIDNIIVPSYVEVD